jgi:vitamin K-dependent gamma-carboxylase
MTESRGLAARLSAPSSTAGLVVFRILLGAIVSIGAVRFLLYGWVDRLFVEPSFFLSYWGFSWVRPMPSAWMHALFVAMAVLGLAYAAGVCFRAVAVLLATLVAYVELIDVTNWLNHYYLLGVLLVLTSFMPLGRSFSVGTWRKPETKLDAFPVWCTLLLRFQVGVVYVHAGLAKLTTDWLLHAQPMNIWLSARTDMPLVGGLFGERATAYAFSWGGFLFDTTIVFFLMYRRTRPFAYAAVVAFHATVGLLFPIGMFPIIMIVAAQAFFAPDWPTRFLATIRRTKRTPFVPLACPKLTRGSLVFVSTFCLFQAAWPLRAHLYGGSVAWHEQGMRFSWRVMVREKNGIVTYIVESRDGTRTWYVQPRQYLNGRQERELASQPDLIVQLARRIARDFRDRGFGDVAVRADAYVSLNGRPAARMIDPSVDLSLVDDGLAKASWILPAPSGAPIHLDSTSSRRGTSLAFRP